MGKESICERVRQYASVAGLVTRLQIREALGLTAGQARSATETLVKQGRLVRIGHGTYEFVSERRSAREAPLEDRIWHAMRISPKFSASEIARLSGSTTSYIYKRMRIYRAEEFVASQGRRETPAGTEKLWRLTAKGQEHIQRPAVEEYQPDPLIVAAVKLNRLVCTGLIRFVEGREEALRLVLEIGNMLSVRSDFQAI